MSDIEKEPYSNAYLGVIVKAFKDHHEGMYSWLSNIGLPPEAGRPTVPVVYATPERAFAKVVAPQAEGQVDLPVITYYCSGMNLNQQRRFLPPYVQFQKQKVGDGWRLYSKAMPWDLTYNVTVITNKVNQADIINWQIITRFTPNSYIKLGRAAICLKLESAVDTSSLEPGKDKDRIVRRDYTINAEGWLELPYQDVGSIGSVITELNDAIMNCRFGEGNELNREFVINDGAGIVIDLVHPWKDDYSSLKVKSEEIKAEYVIDNVSGEFGVANQTSSKIIINEEDN